MIGDVKARIVRSDGQEMTLGNEDWRIPNDGLENWAYLPLSVNNVELTSYDGSAITNERVTSQDRSIKAISQHDHSELRMRAIKFFNPKYHFEVHLTYRGNTRWTEGALIGFKASEENIYKNAEIEFTILCPNPYLRSEDNFGKDIAEVVPFIGFPFMSLIPNQENTYGFNTGNIASLHTFAKDVEIYNDGDVPTGMEIYIRAKGDVVNPSVRLGEGWVRLLVDMVDGDEIYLNAESHPPVVQFNGENALNKVDKGSSILNLQFPVGNTTIEYDADDGDQFMSVAVFYNKQYLGV